MAIIGCTHIHVHIHELEYTESVYRYREGVFYVSFNSFYMNYNGLNLQGSQISKILMKVCMICLLFWSSFFSTRNQSSRTVKHQVDHYVHAYEVESEHMGMSIITKMGNDGLPLRYDKNNLLI